MRKKKKPTRKKRTRPQARPPVIQHQDRLEGNCPECQSAVTVRKIENFPSPIRRATVHYKLSFCNYCAWNNVELEALVPQALKPLTEYELAQIHEAVIQRIQKEVGHYAEFQGKLSTMPFGMATGVIGAALGFDGAELSIASQLDKGISLDVAYGELCQALAGDPLAPVVFEALATDSHGHGALMESLVYWRDKGKPPPWVDLVKPYLENWEG